jgi:hypothetical protein
MSRSLGAVRAGDTSPCPDNTFLTGREDGFERTEDTPLCDKGVAAESAFRMPEY